MSVEALLLVRQGSESSRDTATLLHLTPLVYQSRRYYLVCGDMDGAGSAGPASATAGEAES